MPGQVYGNGWLSSAAQQAAGWGRLHVAGSESHHPIAGVEPLRATWLLSASLAAHLEPPALTQEVSAEPIDPGETGPTLSQTQCVTPPSLLTDFHKLYLVFAGMFYCQTYFTVALTIILHFTANWGSRGIPSPCWTINNAISELDSLQHISNLRIGSYPCKE